MVRWQAIVWVAWLLCPPVAAQSLNVDFGPPQFAPDSSYGAVGEAGTWNGVEGNQGVSYSLLGLDAQPSGVTVLNIGGSEILTTDHPETTDDVERLLDDYLVTYTPNLETCLFFNGLENGTYIVITYAWLPSSPLDSWVTVDQSAQGGVLVGGTWFGGLQEEVTHSIHTAEVTTGALALHSGIPAGGFPQIAALNGVQLVKVVDDPQFLRGDANGNGTLGLDDAIYQLGVLFAGEGPPPCADALDANDDGVLALGDAVQFLAHLFADGPPLSEPFDQCGADPTDDALGCEDPPC